METFDPQGAGMGRLMHLSHCAGAAHRTEGTEPANRTRPAIANERLKRDGSGDVVLQLKSAWRDGTTHIKMSQSGGTARIFLRTQTARYHFPPLRLATFHYTSVSCGSQRLLQERKSVTESRRIRCHVNHAVDDGNFK